MSEERPLGISRDHWGSESSAKMLATLGTYGLGARGMVAADGESSGKTKMAVELGYRDREVVVYPPSEAARIADQVAHYRTTVEDVIAQVRAFEARFGRPPFIDYGQLVADARRHSPNPPRYDNPVVQTGGFGAESERAVRRADLRPPARTDSCPPVEPTFPTFDPFGDR